MGRFLWGAVDRKLFPDVLIFGLVGCHLFQCHELVMRCEGHQSCRLSILYHRVLLVIDNKFEILAGLRPLWPHKIPTKSCGELRFTRTTGEN